jgi:precorrin-6B methylase 2
LLLGIGNGTGELSIPISKYFERVAAIDPDEQMLREGARKTRRLTIMNIDWAQIVQGLKRAPRILCGATKGVTTSLGRGRTRFKYSQDVFKIGEG